MDAIARQATPHDHPRLIETLSAVWEGSNGYHESVRARWAAEFPGVLAEFEAILIVERNGEFLGFGGVQRHPIPYTPGLERALLDHFIAPHQPPEALGEVALACGRWCAPQGFARLTLNMEPEERANLEILALVGAFPERVAMFTGVFPEDPVDPCVQDATPEQHAEVIAMGAAIADWLCEFPGSLGHPSMAELKALTETSYRDYAAERPNRTLVYLRDGRPVGFCFTTFESPHGGLIYDLYVEPASRRQGISRALYVAATRWLRDSGAQWLTLSVFAENMPAYLAYCQWGFFPYFVAWELNLKS